MSAPPRDDTDSVYIGKDAARVDLVVRLPTVSSVHARILRTANGWAIEDLGSTNGTHVDGVLLTAGVPHAISFGAQIRLGTRNGFEFGPDQVVKLTDPASFERPVDLRVVAMADPAPQAAVDRLFGDEDVARRVPRESRRSPRYTEAIAGLNAVPAGAEDTAVSDDFATVEDTNADGTVDAPVGDDRGAILAEPVPPGAPTLTIGYDASNDLVVSNPVVSGRHARIGFDGQRFVLEDMGSTNGTWVAGQRILRAEIRVDDSFTVGGVRLAFDAAMARRLRDREAGPRSPASSNVLKRGRRISVGRAPGNDLVIEAPMVSTRHLVLEVVDGGYVVSDLDSTNGTFLNRRENRITSPATIGDADVLYLGSYRLPVSRVAALVDDVGWWSSTPGTSKRWSIVIGRDPTADVTIDQPQVSRRHAEVVQLDDGVFQIRDLGSSNGVYVNGQRIHAKTRVTADDRVSIGGVDLRLDAQRGVVHRAYSGDIMLQAQRVSVDVPDNAKRGSTKRILSDVSFTAYPSEFVGLMGPSGAGKTTLMMALNGYTPPVTGQSLINGTDLYANYNAFRGNIGYVPQDDIVYPQLTVYESLWYTARLRLPPDTTSDEIEARIERILGVLEIQGTRDVRIGDAVKKGISGGQRKRVNLAQELITEPSLLFLDEPTSGLASEDTINVMRLLRGLADEGRTILLTIHQPSLEAYRLMDNVIYLFNGHLVYYGPTWPDSIDFFHPDATDAERTQLRADPGNALKPLAQDQRAVFEKPKDEQSAALDETVRARKQAYVDSPAYRQYVYDRVGRQAAQDVRIEGGRKQKTDRKGLLRQWWILTRRAALIKWKDRLNTFILMVQAPIIACVLAAVFAVDAADTAWVDELVRGPAALFLLVSSSVWFGASNSAREIVTEQAIYRRERMVNLAIPSYVSSKFAVLGVVSALQCLIMLGIVWWPLSLEGSFGMHYLVLLMTSLVGLGMGLTLSALVRSAEAAVALVPLLLIPQIILGGVIMPVHEMNKPMHLLSNLMAARWGYEAALHIEYADDDLASIRDRCDVPECVWAIGPTGFTFYAGDPDTAREGEQTGGVDALGDLPPSPAAVVEAPLCEAFCASLRFGDEITPLDRSFGADPLDPVREHARVTIVEENEEPDAWTAPRFHSRTSLVHALSVLGAALVFLGALVMSLLRYRDVEVD